MAILQLIQHPTHVFTNDWSSNAEKLIEQGNDEYYIILYYFNIVSPTTLEKMLSIYSIAEMFELSNCYLGRNYAVATLWHIVKKPHDTIKTSVYFPNAHSEPDKLTSDNQLIFPKKYDDEYLEYLLMLEKWMITDEQPADIAKKCEFNTIKSSEFDVRRHFPRFYRKGNDDIRPLISISNPNMVSLCSIANIYSVHCDMQATKDDMVQVLDYQNPHLRYPFNYEKDTVKYFKTVASKWPPTFIGTDANDLPIVEENKISSVIHKGDIIEMNHHFYLLNEEPKFDVYAPPQAYIIRLKENAPVSREYLYLYYNSRTFAKIHWASKMPISNDVNERGLTIGGIDETPIVLPEKDDEFYQEQFYLLSHPSKRTYNKSAVLQEKSVEDALDNELQQSVSIIQNNLVKSEITEDLQELNICYKSGAYKASLVMAGSILEAFLIDWLSELYKQDYFQNRFRVPDYDPVRKDFIRDQENNIKYHNADLVDYINEINDLLLPNWIDQARKAHEIREKRNLVHAQLCLKEDIDINSDLCEKVIQYLNYVIQSRWQNNTSAFPEQI